MNLSIVITGLPTGGAELMLLKLLEGINRDRFAVRVYSLTSLGEVGPRIQALGIPVEALGMGGGVSILAALATLARRFRQTRVDVVHTWLYHADLVGGLAARAAGVRAIAWCIRNNKLDRDKSKFSTRCVVRTNALLSRWVPKGIISCAEAARDVHIGLGYSADKFSIIPNGFDLARFCPDNDARDSVRAELGLESSTPLIGMIGRFDPQKNHVGFVDAAAMVLRAHPKAHFLLAGTGVEPANKVLDAEVRRHGLGSRMHLLGRRDDMPRLMASLDVLASASFSEAFPNVLGEAMACAVPCAVTDAGDSAHIVGDTGRVVAPGDMAGLAEALQDLLALEPDQRRALGLRAKTRIENHFDIRFVTRQYEEYYEQLVSH